MHCSLLRLWIYYLVAAGLSAPLPAAPLTTAGATVRRVTPTPPLTYTLRLAERWFLNLPQGERFDASALLLQPDGSLLTVNDKVPGLYRIDRHTNNTADLIRDPAWFTAAQLARLNPNKVGHWDLEGLARDPQGRIYVCEELNRWVLRCDPTTGQLERLPIDWKPVEKWFSADLNASWEGIAAGTNGRLYLANERSVGRIVVVDLATLKVIDDFQVAPLGRPARDIHYSDLCWFERELWVLCRESRRVLRVDPASHKVLADFDYTGIELSVENGYAAFIPFGQFEGLAVDTDNLWLIVDNNGTGRILDRNDTRPTLYRCPRPDR